MKQYAFGVDIGGTAIKFGFFKTTGELLDMWEIPTNKEAQGSLILKAICDEINQKLQEKHVPKDAVEGIGVGVPGPVSRDGLVLTCVNLGWDILPIEHELQQLTGLKVRAGNDANVAALGEMWQGGGKGYHSIVMITLGTGVGGGVVINGEILAGCDGAAGEIGHIHVKDGEAKPCGCGNYGCLEQYASATGVVNIAKTVIADCSRPTVLSTVDLDAKRVFDAAREQDAVACGIVNEVCKLLGTAIAQISCVVNPQAFVIGGGMSKAGDCLMEPIKAYFQTYSFHAARHTEIKQAELGNNAGIYGGVQLVIANNMEEK